MDSASSRAPVPFWHRVPELFLLPLKPPAIVVTLVATVLATLGFLMDGIGFWLYLAATIGVLYYGRALLVASAAGEHEPPPLELPQEGWLTPLKLWVLFTFPYLLIVPLYVFFGPWVMAILLFVYLLALPAAVLVLAVDNSLHAALSPSAVFGVIRALGGSYWILWLFILFLNGAKAALLGPLDDGSAVINIPAVAVALAIDFHFTLISCRLLGYAAYQNQHRLGYETDDMADTDPGLAQYREFLAEHRYGAAADELRAYILDNPDRLDLRLQRHKLLKLADDKALTREAGRLIQDLLVARSLADALTVYGDARAMDAEYRPTIAGLHTPLAEALREAGRPADAVHLLSGYHKRFPDDPLLPGVYGLAARILAVDLNQGQKAGQLLNMLLQRFADHPQAESWRRLQAAVKPAG